MACTGNSQLTRVVGASPFLSAVLAACGTRAARQLILPVRLRLWLVLTDLQDQVHGSADPVSEHQPVLRAQEHAQLLSVGLEHEPDGSLIAAAVPARPGLPHVVNQDCRAFAGQTMPMLRTRTLSLPLTGTSRKPGSPRPELIINGGDPAGRGQARELRGPCRGECLPRGHAQGLEEERGCRRCASAIPEQNRWSSESGTNLKPHAAHLRVRGSGVVMVAIVRPMDSRISSPSRLSPAPRP